MSMAPLLRPALSSDVTTLEPRYLRCLTEHSAAEALEPEVSDDAVDR